MFVWRQRDSGASIKRAEMESPNEGFIYTFSGSVVSRKTIVND